LNKQLTFRALKTSDIETVLEIYNFHIQNGFANFEEKPFLYNDFFDLCQNIINIKLPFIVCIFNKKVIGFAFLNNFRNKSGYRYSFENSIYLNSDYAGKGIGSKLLEELISISSKNSKIKNIIAVIGGKNPESSIQIHKKNGFVIIGTLKNIGFKKKEWLDAIYMQKILNEKK
jgi:L-amino acid N-acyltransferase YncA